MRPLGGALAIAVLAVACSVPGLEPPPPPGSRQWTITVENRSNRPTILIVAEDQSPPGAQVGSADPDVVPAQTTIDVVFTVPPGRGWAIFVNPGPNLGPLILASDVPQGVAGDLPLTIMVDRDGNPSVSVPSQPGWFGN